MVGEGEESWGESQTEGKKEKLIQRLERGKKCVGSRKGEIGEGIIKDETVKR